MGEKDHIPRRNGCKEVDIGSKDTDGWWLALSKSRLMMAVFRGIGGNWAR